MPHHSAVGNSLLSFVDQLVEIKGISNVFESRLRSCVYIMAGTSKTSCAKFDNVWRMMRNAVFEESAVPISSTQVQGVFLCFFLNSILS